jgi:hypothetical protein
MKKLFVLLFLFVSLYVSTQNLNYIPINKINVTKITYNDLKILNLEAEWDIFSPNSKDDIRIYYYNKKYTEPENPYFDIEGFKKIENEYANNLPFSKWLFSTNQSKIIINGINYIDSITTSRLESSDREIARIFFTTTNNMILIISIEMNNKNSEKLFSIMPEYFIKDKNMYLWKDEEKFNTELKNGTIMNREINEWYNSCESIIKSIRLEY